MGYLKSANELRTAKYNTDICAARKKRKKTYGGDPKHNILPLDEIDRIQEAASAVLDNAGRFVDLPKGLMPGHLSDCYAILDDLPKFAEKETVVVSSEGQQWMAIVQSVSRNKYKKSYSTIIAK